MASSVQAAHFSGLGAHLGNMWTYVDVGRTGTGSAETIKHGQSRRPLLVLVQVDDEATATATLGVTTADNIVVTVTNGKTYHILAFFAPGT